MNARLRTICPVHFRRHISRSIVKTDIPFQLYRMVKFNICFILGGPGAGKGTICEKIVQDFGYIHLSAGELLRQASNAPGSQHSEEIKRHMKAGTIVPAQVTCDLLHQAMLDNYNRSQHLNYLVDGFPRNRENRDAWETTLGSKTVLKRVIVLDCPDEICVRRCMTRQLGRLDDNIDTLERRLKQFKEQCQPIIDYYESLGLVSRIDASKSKEEVLAQVKNLMLTTVCI